MKNYGNAKNINKLVKENQFGKLKRIKKKQSKLLLLFIAIFSYLK